MGAAIPLERVSGYDDTSSSSETVKSARHRGDDDTETVFRPHLNRRIADESERIRRDVQLHYYWTFAEFDERHLYITDFASLYRRVISASAEIELTQMPTFDRLEEPPAKYPGWLNAAAWSTLALVPLGLVGVLVGLTAPGLVLMGVGFGAIWLFGELAHRRAPKWKISR